MHPLESYLAEIRDLRSTGATVQETSYYSALSTFLNELGASLKPRVRCVINLASTGSGIPDIGLFTQDQFQNRSAHEPLSGQLPERGVLEVKPPSADVEKVAGTEQVAKYLSGYGVVLVTNYRDFLLVTRDDEGKPLFQERYTIAPTESDFWKRIKTPALLTKEHHVAAQEFLTRVLLYNAPISQPKDVAWFLASYARDAKQRVESTPLHEMDVIREALEQALGIQFRNAESQHFFRSTLVQTLFYGVFSAFVLWHREHLPVKKGDRFDWRTAGFSITVPIISALFHEVANPARLKPLGLDRLLDWTAGALNRVNRQEFFAQFDEGNAVQYFYEPFLEAFDPELRKDLGVWYTPPEVVQYQVERVDRVLRSEMGLADGLADPSVFILDPCCGTGAYLVEVLHRIEKTLRERGEDALIGSDLKQAAMERVIGFEILPAPFVVAHLQIGILLQKYGSSLIDTNDRAAIYLTNALTGWEPPTEQVKAKLKQLELQFPEFRRERDAADAIKRKRRVLVVLGNPPYNAFAGTSPEEEEGIVEPYKGIYYDDKGRRRYKLNDPVSKGGWGIKKFNLDDLYIRFFRLAERCIAEISGTGVISFISNFSYVSEQSFVILRERMLSNFDKLWIDCMNGDSRQTGKQTPSGEPDPSVFSTSYNAEGIKKGTAICVLVRKPKPDTAQASVHYRDFWGVQKRALLQQTLTEANSDEQYTLAEPLSVNRFSFVQPVLGQII